MNGRVTAFLDPETPEARAARRRVMALAIVGAALFGAAMGLR